MSRPIQMNFIRSVQFSIFSRKAVFILLGFVALLVASGFYLFNSSPTLRGSQIIYKAKDRYSDQVITRQGRILALPGESIRFNLQNDQIYIKQGNMSYRLVENYLPKSTSTLSLSFNNSWHTLGVDEVLVLSDQRSIQNMQDFVYEDNIVKQSQIISTQKMGKKSDIALKPIDEFNEFSPKVAPSWLGWQIQVDEQINIKNGAVPVASLDVLFVPTMGNKLLALDSRSGQKKWEVSFSNTIFKIIPDEPAKTVSVVTLDNKTSILNITSGEKINETNSAPNAKLPDIQFVVDQNTQFKIEKESAQIALIKTNAVGKTVWRYTSQDIKYFPDRFEMYGDYLVGLGSYGGYYLEDVPYKSSIYVINANTGRLVTLKENLEYANFDVIEDTLVIYDKTLQAYDLLTGQFLWTYPITDDSGSNYKDWIVDQTNKIIYAADSDEVVALRADGLPIWSRKMTSSVRDLRLNNGVLYFLDQGMAKFYALNLVTGDTLWQINTINGSEGPHITNQNEVFFRNLKSTKSQFMNTEFLTLDPLQKTPIKIFDHTTLSDNDILFQYEDQFVYVFTDDFVTAIKYKNN